MRGQVLQFSKFIKNLLIDVWKRKGNSQIEKTQVTNNYIDSLLL